SGTEENQCDHEYKEQFGAADAFENECEHGSLSPSCKIANAINLAGGNPGKSRASMVTANCSASCGKAEEHEGH
ncbi:MAG TPA: hypothetical protein VF290_08890, partial [Pyrinomonadaceae bacterium]